MNTSSTRDARLQVISLCSICTNLKVRSFQLKVPGLAVQAWNLSRGNKWVDNIPVILSTFFKKSKNIHEKQKST